MPCYTIPYTNTYGSHTCTKWANTGPEAVALAKASLAKKGGCGEVELGKAVLVHPQPFSDEARMLREMRDAKPASAVLPAAA